MLPESTSDVPAAGTDSLNFSSDYALICGCEVGRATLKRDQTFCRKFDESGVEALSKKRHYDDINTDFFQGKSFDLLLV